uniref:MMPL family transporter n=1 Tax=Rheinheimera sp. TaxID=1869214 RepID=UPI0040472566
MLFVSSPLLARVILLIFVGSCAGWLLQVDYDQKITTNVIDLFPTEERSPEIGIIRDFSTSSQSRVMLFALGDHAAPSTPPQVAASEFAGLLRQSGLFQEINVLGASTSFDELGRSVFERRFELLFPSWLGQKSRAFAKTGKSADSFSDWLAQTSAEDLEAFLERPEAIAVQDILPSDPLLLVPNLIKHARLASPPDDGNGYALVWSLIEESPMIEAGQKPVFDVIDASIDTLRAKHIDIDVRWSGINRFAAASRERIESEVKLLHVLSIAAVLSVCLLFVRRLAGILHFVPIIALSILGAWTASTLVFDRLHVLVFVIGSLLAGVAIDYGVYIYMHPQSQPDETYADKLQRLLKPLLTSCLTTAAGFSFLILSDLPLIRQIGLFVSAGLLTAIVVAMLYFAQVKQPFLESRKLGQIGFTAPHPALSRLIRVLAIVMFTIVLLGSQHLKWKDDVRELDIPSPELRANDAEIRALWGNVAGSSSAYLSFGESTAAARDHLQVFLDHTAINHPEVAASSIGLLLPTAHDWQALPARLQALETFPEKFRSALESRGFEAAAFSYFFEALEAFKNRSTNVIYSDVVEDMNEILTGPIALLQNSSGPYWFLTLVEGDIEISAPPGAQTIAVNQLQSLNELFGRYRWSALKLSLIGLSFILISIFSVYSPLRGLRIAIIPFGACMVVFGGFGLGGQTLNLFNLLGAFLGFCLSHNYAIFSSSSTHTGNVTPVAIRLSALSTASAFGVLVFSQIPAVHDLGLTVSLIVITSLIMIEFEPLLRKQQT